MKILKSKSGRKVMLYDSSVNIDYGKRYQRELIDSYELAKTEGFFRGFAKWTLIATLFFIAGAFLR